jgi:peptide/nickel transport system permease protein
MLPSIPASDTAELPTAARLPVAPAGGGLLADVARTPAGALGLALTAAAVLAAALAPVLAPADPFAITGPPLAPPGPGHPMGTDGIGRDLLSGVLHGARTSLLVAGGVGVVAFLVGAAIGTVSGYLGGRVDDGLMRGTELVQVLPRFFLAIVAIALLGPGVDRLVLVLGLTSWPVLARVVRAEVLALERLEFVRAAEATGASALRIMVRELLPNVLPSALVMLGLLLGQVLLIEASLGFLGLGDPNLVSWGSLAGDAQRFLLVAWWLPFFPGLAIALTVLGLNLLGDAATAALTGR